jgi:hypothetical protein
MTVTPVQLVRGAIVAQLLVCGLVLSGASLTDACTPALQAASDAPTSGEALFLETEVACLVAHASEPLDRANGDCGIEAARGARLAGCLAKAKASAASSATSVKEAGE